MYIRGTSTVYEQGYEYEYGVSYEYEYHLVFVCTFKICPKVTHIPQTVSIIASGDWQLFVIRK